MQKFQMFFVRCEWDHNEFLKYWAGLEQLQRE